MNRIALTAFVVLVGCGGEEAAAPKPAAPAPASAPAPSPTPTVAASASASVEPPAPKLSMAEMQKKHVADDEAAWNAKDAKKLAALYAEDAEFVGSGPMGRVEVKGRTTFEESRAKAFVTMSKAFPDMKWFKSRALQSGPVMVVEWGTSGTDTGGFKGEPPSNKKVGWRGVSILWFGDDGLVKKEHNVIDFWQPMLQMGKGDPKAKFRAPPEVPSGPLVWVAANGSEAEKKNLETARSMYPLFEKKDEKAYLALMTDDAVHSDQVAAEDAKGKAALRKEFAALTKAFPDLKVTPTESWAFGDVVVVETEMAGTFKNALGALKPTNKSGTVHAIDVIELKDGKIARVTSYGNGFEFAKVYELPMPAKK